MSKNKQLKKGIAQINDLYKRKKNKENKKLLKAFILEKVYEVKAYNKSLKTKSETKTVVTSEVKLDAIINPNGELPALQPSANLIDVLKAEKLADTE
jgi:hypothetical protein